MAHFDVFNGDADGLCALHQLRLVEPAEATLITDVKRSIRLVERFVPPPGAVVTVLDVSFAVNRTAAERLLADGCRVRWFDHHYAGALPEHPALEAHIDPSPEVCTSLLVSRHLGGRHAAWAVAAAFGDNLGAVARREAGALGLSAEATGVLEEVGTLLNYNGYGGTLADLHFHPADLYRAMRPHADPLAFAREAPELGRLREAFHADLAAAGTAPLADEGAGRVVHLPDAPWARRIVGTWANRLANEDPQRAVAVAVDNPDGTLRISVRAPLARPQGADDLCRAFPTGGGRAGAAGINALPPGALERFLAAFRETFGG